MDKYVALWRKSCIDFGKSNEEIPQNLLNERCCLDSESGNPSSIAINGSSVSEAKPIDESSAPEVNLIPSDTESQLR